MFPTKPRRWLGVATLACVAAHAQHQGQAPAAAEPASASAPYRSALGGYQSFGDQKVQSWTDSNATVRSVGGWRAYAKEAAGATAAEPAIPAIPATPAQSHAGHHTR